MSLPPLPFPNTVCFILFPLLLLLLRSITAGNSPVHNGSRHAAVAVNCGFPRNSTASNGRQWVGETDSASIIFHGPGSKSVSPLSLDRLSSLDPTPYLTARASRSFFTYTFLVGPGYKFIRLHFYPASYSGFKQSTSFLTVKSGSYTLLNNFSAMVAVDFLGLKSIVKEFTLYVPDDNESLSITFYPSRANPSDQTFAFVNGIEVVPMPLGLYYTMAGDVGAYVVGQNYRLPIGRATAMEMIHRLNVGGGSLSSAYDTTMFREWTDDSNYMIESNVFPISASNRIKYTETSKNGAPQRVYQTSWSMNRNTQLGEGVSFIWKLPVDLGFRYLIRLHFCELDYDVKDIGQKEFSILINNQMVEPRGDLIRWGGKIGVAIHKDYLMTVRGDRMMGQRDLFIALYPGNANQSSEFVDAILKGIEVFKMSNPDDNLAGVNPIVFRPHAQINHMLKKPTTAGNYIATVFIILVTLLNVIVFQIREWREKTLRESISHSVLYEEFCCRFSFVEILSATNNFDKELEIGHGGFGKVYKGAINGKTKTVAIKRLSSESKQGEKEFRSEIEILSKHRHEHLVSLIGYCNEGREMILVYEYMERGTLADHLHKNKRDGNVPTTPLSWEQRLNVCLGAARGLDYLHTSSEHGTIHRDVKSENILLDLNWVAKIADFGICKVGTTSNTRTISTDLKGTFGYIDPEYFLTRSLTKKSDVYAFGVVLWEALCGRPALDTRTEGEQRSLVLWVQSCFKEGMVDSIIDSSLRGQISTGSLKLYLELANQCLHNQSNGRPTMAEVTHGLESVLAAAISQAQEEVADVNSEFGSDEIDLNSSSPPMSFISSTSSGPLQLDDNHMQLRKKKKSKLGKIFQRNFQALVRSIDIRRRKRRENSSVMELDPHLENMLLPFRRFSFDEVRTATHNFSNVIGMGAFSNCYKGMIDDGTTMVAIKETHQEQRLNELYILSKTNHVNIVNLIGYCNEEGKTFLVLEYIDNWSLNDHLHDKNKNPLSWKKRLEICIGAARGLHYLHDEMLQTVIHRDVKPAKILIDRNWVAKLSGFGVASTALSYYDTHVSTMICGTMGYIDPEYCVTARLTLKSDVYSFGLVLLEVLCSKKPVVILDDGSSTHIVQYIRDRILENTIHNAVDPYLVGRISPDCLIQYLRIAMKCVDVKGIDRPSIEVVLSGLCNVLRMQETWQFDASLDPPSGATVSFMDSAADEWFHTAVGQAYNNIVHHGRPLPFRRFSLAEVTTATLNFSNVIGEGGSSKCYKGMIENGTTLVAVKETNSVSQGLVDELLIMSQINHRNIVNFIGYCNEECQMLRVWEYIDNGSLYDHLHDKNKNPLPWKKRLEICIGAAQGLHYLHSEMLLAVIHRDVKSANILIDSNWVAKVSDLDLASTVLSSSTHVSTVVCGTMGYLDPEYYMTGRLTVKSDVYSFGVVLLEVLSAKKSVILLDEYDSSLHISQYFKNSIEENRIDEAMDPYLVGRIAPDCLIQYLQIALKCVEYRGTDRPSMEVVLSKLRNLLQIQEAWQFDASLDSPSGAPVSLMDSTEDEWLRMAVGRAYNNIMLYGSGGILVPESGDYLPISQNDGTNPFLDLPTTEGIRVPESGDLPSSLTE